VGELSQVCAVAAHDVDLPVGQAGLRLQHDPRAVRREVERGDGQLGREQTRPFAAAWDGEQLVRLEEGEDRLAVARPLPVRVACVREVEGEAGDALGPVAVRPYDVEGERELSRCSAGKQDRAAVRRPARAQGPEAFREASPVREVGALDDEIGCVDSALGDEGELLRVRRPVRGEALVVGVGR